MSRFVPCLVPPPLRSEDGRLSPSSVLLDYTAYISADAVSNGTTAGGNLSNGCPIHVSFCLAPAPRLSYLCVHFPGPAAGSGIGTVIGPAAGTPAVQCVNEPPRVISTHADLALIRVPIPGALRIFNEYDYFVYTARPQPGASSLDLLPKAHSGFRDKDVAILRDSHRYVIACLRNTLKSEELFSFQLYDSNTRRWSTRLLRVENPAERDEVLPIPFKTATEVLFHNTTKVVTLGGPNGTVGWVDLWRGILFCNVLDEMPVLRDMPLPKPARSNRRDFCIGCPHSFRDITVAAGKQQGSKVIKYVEMETRPGNVLSSRSSESDSDSDDEAVADYWTATIWTMPVPISSSWKDWHKDCTIDVTNIIIDNPSHSELLLRLPRHSADPEDARYGLMRMTTAHPTLGLGINGDVISFLSKEDVRGARGWVIAVNMTSQKLNGVAELDIRKNSYFQRYYVPTEISKYLTKATGEAGTLLKTTSSNRKSIGARKMEFNVELTSKAPSTVQELTILLHTLQ
ncbi:hypothetical protein PR202_gb11530 [Eleusine coracana subsp. coracana]|uniref:DUF1618 domain-containing protein n=1 Tax=Eleusine coracana subsp. coracana TaxID=191504 RepID=A0AAV5EN85_ELECO|nr:hypothetical protein QOZ80_3BG0268010 [Eleusine coracana subsp. coracana]GJN23842.1 hypothetical protein PR202_gb11530 [Eleusine coracana subsp. coracana]